MDHYMVGSNKMRNEAKPKFSRRKPMRVYYSVYMDQLYTVSKEEFTTYLALEEFYGTWVYVGQL